MFEMNGDWIRRARQEISELQRRRAAKNRLDKLTSTEDQVEVELFLDDLAAEGIDLKSPVGVAIAMRAWCLKKGEQLHDEMEREHDDLSF
jgi:hypothetical protein